MACSAASQAPAPGAVAAVPRQVSDAVARPVSQCSSRLPRRKTRRRGRTKAGAVRADSTSRLARTRHCCCSRRRRPSSVGDSRPRRRGRPLLSVACWCCTGRGVFVGKVSDSLSALVSFDWQADAHPLLPCWSCCSSPPGCVSRRVSGAQFSARICIERLRREMLSTSLARSATGRTTSRILEHCSTAKHAELALGHPHQSPPATARISCARPQRRKWWGSSIAPASDHHHECPRTAWERHAGAPTDIVVCPDLREQLPPLNSSN